MDDQTTRIAAVAMHSVMGDPSANLARVEHWCRQVHEQNARFALFPEECVTGSMNKSDLTMAEAQEIAQDAVERAVPRLESLCRELTMTVAVGTIEPGNERVRNSVLIVGPDGYLATFSKLHMPNPTEREWFEPGNELPVVTSQGWTFSVGICYDLRFPEIFRAAARHGADFFLLAVGGSGATEEIATDGDQTEQAQYHKAFAMQCLPARAVDNALYIFYANQAGTSGNAQFPGLALAVDPDGELVAEHLPDEDMIVVEVSREAIAAARSGSKCTVSEARPEIYGAPVIVREEVS